MWNLQQGFGAGGFGGRVAYRCFIFSEKTMGKGTSKCLWLLSTCDGVWVVILMPEKMIQFEFICFKWVGKHLPATVAMVNRKVRNLPPQSLGWWSFLGWWGPSPKSSNQVGISTIWNHLKEKETICSPSFRKDWWIENHQLNKNHPKSSWWLEPLWKICSSKWG